jgi:alpha-glucosidase
MDIDKLIYYLRSNGIDGIYRAIHSAITRDIIEKRSCKKSFGSEAIYPGEIQKITPVFGGVQVDFNHANVVLEFLTQNLIRVSWSPGKPPVPYTIDKTDWEFQQPVIESDENGCLLSCGNLNVKISRIGEISFHDQQNNILYQFDRPYLIGESWHLSRPLKSEEHIYGLGERAAPLNLRPGIYTSWNTDAKGSYSTGTDPLYIGTPIYLSLSNSGSHLVYFENSYKSRFSIGEKFEANFAGGMLRYYIFFGSLDIIFKQLMDLVGHPFLPPRWVLGYHQCRWGYKSAEDVRNVIKGFKEHDLPSV